jgi:hypothetical protein
MDKQESDNLESDNLESDKLKSDKQLELILKWAGAVVLTKHCWARSDTNWVGHELRPEFLFHRLPEKS